MLYTFGYFVEIIEMINYLIYTSGKLMDWGRPTTTVIGPGNSHTVNLLPQGHYPLAGEGGALQLTFFFFLTGERTGGHELPHERQRRHPRHRQGLPTGELLHVLQRQHHVR